MIEKKYATATEIYTWDDFEGPPPFGGFEEVYAAQEVDALVKCLRDYLKMGSIDGRPERRVLRDKLAEIIA